MFWIDGIKSVTIEPMLPGNSPANVNRVTGELKVSQYWIDRLPDCHIAFIILHEINHIREQTTDEREADAAAFRDYVRMGLPVQCSIYALSDVLNMSNPEHLERVELAYKRALNFDYPNEKKKWRQLNFLRNTR